MSKPEIERLAGLEVQMVDMHSDIDEIKRDIKEIMVVIPIVNDHEKRMLKIEKKSFLWSWLSPTCGAVAGSILTFLIIEYLRKL